MGQVYQTHHWNAHQLRFVARLRVQPLLAKELAPDPHLAQAIVVEAQLRRRHAVHGKHLAPTHDAQVHGALRVGALSREHRAVDRAEDSRGVGSVATSGSEPSGPGIG